MIAVRVEMMIEAMDGGAFPAAIHHWSALRRLNQDYRTECAALRAEMRERRTGG